MHAFGFRCFQQMVFTQEVQKPTGQQRSNNSDGDCENHELNTASSAKRLRNKPATTLPPA